MAIVAVSVLATTAKGDVVPFSGAEVAKNIAVFRLEDEGVRLELEIYPEDLPIFKRALSSELVASPLSTPASFLQFPDQDQNVFFVAHADGRPLPFHFLSMERRKRIDRASPFAGMKDPISGAVVPGPPDNPDVFYLEAFFSFEGAQPESLIIRPIYAADGSPAASTGFMVFDRAVPVTRFSFLKRDTQLRINWPDPWYTAFSNPNLNRAAQSGTSSFLYVAPRELRHEVLIRVRELAPWIGENLATGASLDPVRQSQLLAAALKEFTVRNPVRISDQFVAPASVRGSFLTIGARGYQVVEDSPMLVADTTFVGVILSYPVPDLPATASISWDMFDENIQKVPVTLTDSAGPFYNWASPDVPEVIWTNHLKRYENPNVEPVPAAGVVFVPLWPLMFFVLVAGAGVIAACSAQKHVRFGFAALALGCLVAGMAMSGKNKVAFVTQITGQTEDQLAAAVFSQLLLNTYVAGLEMRPDGRKKALGPIVFDASQADLAAELETSLTIQVPGGGRAQIADVTDVAIVEGDMNRHGAFEGVAQWRVDARAGHWGHDHRRWVDYRARVEFRPDRGNWILSAITVLEARSPDV
ncbi:hypothetical protein [Ruegeria sp. SCP11]|uniref:hypothetical protein n=1 Tax=Ruegeria sp. SCP11 TaxID=3141378 RepID=UPI00333C347B